MTTATDSNLPQIIGTDGEVIRAVTAHDLIRAAGLELHVAEKVDLAEFSDGCRHLEEIAKEARGYAGDELVNRLDRDGAWTWRDAGFEVKAPSPAAGTTAYDTDLLRQALEHLVEEDTISREAAHKALEPIWPTAAIDQPTLGLLVQAVAGMDTDGEPIDGDALQAHRAAALEALEAAIAGLGKVTYKQKPAGIKALQKIPAAAAAIDGAKVDVEPPHRRATVKRVRPVA